MGLGVGLGVWVAVGVTVGVEVGGGVEVGDGVEVLALAMTASGDVAGSGMVAGVASSVRLHQEAVRNHNPSPMTEIVMIDQSLPGAFAIRFCIR